MAIQAKKQNPWFVIAILVAAAVLWAIDQKKAITPEKPDPTPRTERAEPKGTPPPPSERPKISARTVETEGDYEVYRNCTLSAEKNNDGDSFRVRLPNGREEIMRLYFVDTPESAFKSYRGGETNHQRIAEQAEYFHITPEKAVEIGQAGKHFTLDLLGKAPFTIFTCWDSPFNDQRYHAFIEVSENGKPRWLHELLVERGLARLKTKPADLPDGTPASRHREALEAEKKEAMRKGAGAWAR